MKRWTKLATFAAALTLSAASVGIAKPAREAPEHVNISAFDVAPEAEQVDSFTMLRRLHSWSEVDDDTVILWATPFQPYLVELAFPAYDLKFAHAIGVTSVGSRVYAKFDAVKIGGFRYPIESIYKLTREEARAWQRNS